MDTDWLNITTAPGDWEPTPKPKKHKRKKKAAAIVETVLASIERSESPLFPVEHEIDEREASALVAKHAPPDTDNLATSQPTADTMQTDDVTMAPAIEDDNLLDPANSERKLCSDPFTRLSREIWRPGDGDGDQATDYYERAGPLLPLEKRWRLFQTDIGTISLKNQPPRFVMLDDRATYEVLNSDITRAKLTQNWPHDFGGGAKVRTRRPHRGRAAIKDSSLGGDAKYRTTLTGGKKETYYFSGEKDYEPVLYRYEAPVLEPKPKRKRKPSPTDEDYNPRGHGHNQYTPKDMMVKNGAPTFSLKDPKNQLPRLNSHLLYRASPPLFPRDSRKSATPKRGTPLAQTDGESDDEFPIRRPAAGAASSDQSVTPFDLENADDVKKMADELSQANVIIDEQAQEIERLKQALAMAEGQNQVDETEMAMAQEPQL